MYYQYDAVRSPLRPVVALALAALLALPVISIAQTPPAKVLRGDFEVTVVTADGKKFKECTVYAYDQVVALGESGGPGIAKGIPAVLDASYAVTAEARVPQGAGKPDRRYIGVTEAMPEANRTVKVKVSLKPADNINDYCSTCHPGRGQRMRSGMIKRDAHPTDKPLFGRYREQVRKYNANVENLRREGKPTGELILLEERIVKEGGKEVRKEFYTCESCHTLHWVTPYGKYARGNFLESGDLCTGCHY